MTPQERAIESALLNIADPIQFGAEEYWCAMKVLDDMGVPREHEGASLSLVGRIRKATNTFNPSQPNHANQ